MIFGMFAKPVKRLKISTKINFSSKLSLEVTEIFKEGIIHIKMLYNGILLEILDELGEMPLPPYIHEKLAEKDRYQTVYAKNIGSAAAPTAGFHLTNELIEKIKNKGVKIMTITLHVGLGTFRPVQVTDLKDHKMHSEYYQMTKEVADLLNKSKEAGKRIIAVGTTTTRVLETIMTKYNTFKEDSGYTDIFIYPVMNLKLFLFNN